MKKAIMWSTLTRLLIVLATLLILLLVFLKLSEQSFDLLSNIRGLFGFNA